MHLLRKQTFIFNPFAIAILANILLGTAVVANKIGFESMDPVLFNGLRLFFAGFVIFLLVRNITNLKNKRAIKSLLINSAFGIIAVALWSIGLDESTAIKTALLSLITPVFMYLLSLIFLKERLIIQALIGCIVALIGGVMMVGLPALIGQQTEPGDILLLISYFFVALMFVHSKHLYVWLKPMEVVAYRFTLVGAVLTLFMLAQTGFGVFFEASSATWLALLFAVIIPGALGLPLFYWALKQMDGERFAPVLYLDPMVGALASAIILGERLEPGALIGVGVILVGLLISHPHHHRVFRSLHIRQPHPRLHEFTRKLGSLAHQLHR